MTRNEFHEIISMLTRVYGEKVYNSDRVEIFWGLVKELDAVFLRRSISRFIASSQKPALFDDFKTIARGYWINQSAHPEDRSKWRCNACKDTGWTYLRSKPEHREELARNGHPEECAAICDCDAGARVTHSLERTEYADVARRRFKGHVHGQWYTQDIHKPEHYTGKTWEDFCKTVNIETLGV